MFSLKEFLKKGLLDAVGKMADYQIILNAAGWYDKGVLDDNDLIEIQSEIEKQYLAEDIVPDVSTDESEATETDTVLE